MLASAMAGHKMPRTMPSPRRRPPSAPPSTTDAEADTQVLTLPNGVVLKNRIGKAPLTEGLADHLPDRAGTAMLTVGSPDAASGCAVMLAWTLAAVGLWYVRLRRWDG